MSEAKQSKIDFEVWEYILPALPMIAEVSAKGFEKYGTGNWKKVSTQDNLAHAIRHLCLYRDQQSGMRLPDGEEKENHLAHACARLMMELAKKINTHSHKNESYIRHGKWIEKPYLLGTSMFCSWCNTNYGMSHEIYNYCPNCGTKMDLEG